MHLVGSRVEPLFIVSGLILLLSSVNGMNMETA